MNTQRIDIGRGQWIVLRDGIAFFQGLNPQRPAEVSAVPEDGVWVVYRAMPPSTWTSHILPFGYGDATLFVAVAMLWGLSFLIDARASIIPATVLACGLLLILVVFRIMRTRNRRRAGWCGTVLTVAMQFRMLDLKFDRIEGTNPALDVLLDRWKNRRASTGRGRPAGVALLFIRPVYWSLNAVLYSLLWLGFGFDEAFSEYGSLGFALANFLAGTLLLTPYLLTQILEVLLPRALRTARSALLADEVEAARLILEHFLAEKPRHVCGNLLMAAYALMEGDIQLAAKHRQAMGGENGCFRLAETLYTLTHRVSSVKAFQSLAEYAAKGASDTASLQTHTETAHEQPAH